MKCLNRAELDQNTVDTAGTEWVCLNVCGTPVRTSIRTLKAFPGTFFESVLELPSQADCSQNKARHLLTIELDFSLEAVHVLLATLRAARSSVNLAFRAVQDGLARCGVEVRLLFDYVGITWLLPTHLPSDFDDPAAAMSVRYDHFDFSCSTNSMDISGVIHFIHAHKYLAPSPVVSAVTGYQKEGPQPLYAVVNERERRLDILDVQKEIERDRTWRCGKFIYMSLSIDRKLVLDLGSGHALFPTGMLLWISPPPRDTVHLTLSAFSEITGETKAIMTCHMLEFGPHVLREQTDFILCRVPITPSLRELYRMFCLQVEFEAGNDAPSKLFEVEFFGDYLSALAKEALHCQRPRYCFLSEYEGFARGVFEPEVQQQVAA
eukprot:TRINITY_DN36717_c0_g1_i1.p1 TRINITY_DN36717_c0_g1~~TRINITY_DN36717_c0_g1_i1.p1  ORF type:complete len:378 (+),score=52.74 TRINITY_DN36717_c0_g1_i1:64-1197(+)